MSTPDVFSIRRSCSIFEHHVEKTRNAGPNQLRRVGQTASNTLQVPTGSGSGKGRGLRVGGPVVDHQLDETGVGSDEDADEALAAMLSSAAQTSQGKRVCVFLCLAFLYENFTVSCTVQVSDMMVGITIVINQG